MVDKFLDFLVGVDVLWVFLHDDLSERVGHKNIILLPGMRTRAPRRRERLARERSHRWIPGVATDFHERGGCNCDK